MSGCGTLLGARVCDSSSGSAPSWSPWRISIRPRTFAEIAWWREVLCAGACAEIAWRREELRTGPPDAVGGTHHLSGTRSGSLQVSQSRNNCRTMGLQRPCRLSTRNGGSHGNNRWRKDQIFLGQGPGGHHGRPHIHPGECGNPGPKCGRDIGCGYGRHGYTC